MSILGETMNGTPNTPSPETLLNQVASQQSQVASQIQELAAAVSGLMTRSNMVSDQVGDVATRLTVVETSLDGGYRNPHGGRTPQRSRFPTGFPDQRFLQKDC